MAMRIGVGDRVVIEAGYDEYMEYLPNWWDGREGHIFSWYDIEGERWFGVNMEDVIPAALRVPARFVRLVERAEEG